MCLVLWRHCSPEFTAYKPSSSHVMNVNAKESRRTFCMFANGFLVFACVLFSEVSAQVPPHLSISCTLPDADLLEGDVAFLHVILHNHGKEPMVVMGFRPATLVAMRIVDSGLPTGDSLVVADRVPSDEGMVIWPSLKLRPNESKHMLLLIRVVTKPFKFYSDTVVQGSVSFSYKYWDSEERRNVSMHSIGRRLEVDTSGGIARTSVPSVGELEELIHGFSFPPNSVYGSFHYSKKLLRYAEFPLGDTPQWKQVLTGISPKSNLARMIKFSAQCRALLVGHTGSELAKRLHAVTEDCPNEFERVWIRLKLHEQIRWKDPKAAEELAEMCSDSPLWGAETN